MRATVRQAARASAYLARAVALAFGCWLFVTVLLLTVAAAVTVVGIGLLPETVLLIRRIAGAKRRWVHARTGRPLPEVYLPLDPPLRNSLRAIRRDPCTYADLRWMLAHYLYGFLGLAAVALWPIGLVVDGVWCGLLGRAALILPLIDRLAGLDARWSESLLRPPPKALLAERVQELTETRAGAVAAHAAELRRIERDLHDGAQAGLVALSMRIGLARRAFDTDPAAARSLLDEAQSQAEQALTELRHVVRGIHPPILTDRGLSGAVRALAAGSGLPVTVDADAFDDPPRAPAAVEAAAYYVVAEALTNAAKHSGADRAGVRLARTPTGVRITVCDNGRGGAHLPRAGETGSGLLGIGRRIAALDGTFALTSPAGGPTCIEAELPCVW
ncbi:sensor histidine kinase [Nocardia aurantia]|uniref:histidine kinase n=1 Tax=Nocardia aurantia TaxID=2585199 RepID=A0A7K0E134_9NOCA|nr:histidine kinase [Nocardia aurantia]MQY30824.1 hypothetical protein [Nocardia aurantia]